MKYTERGGAKQLDCLSPLKHLPLLNGALIFRLFEDAAGTRDVHACDIVCECCLETMPFKRKAELVSG
uniref:Uncharacterized protein n=1 Tax=Physcomitrium patens TaxID=3218 RepID=A0A7I4CE70_PHYPA